jgi:hypothetical protein
VKKPQDGHQHGTRQDFVEGVKVVKGGPRLQGRELDMAVKCVVRPFSSSARNCITRCRDVPDCSTAAGEMCSILTPPGLSTVVNPVGFGSEFNVDRRSLLEGLGPGLLDLCVLMPTRVSRPSVKISLHSTPFRIHVSHATCWPILTHLVLESAEAANIVYFLARQATV